MPNGCVPVRCSVRLSERLLGLDPLVLANLEKYLFLFARLWKSELLVSNVAPVSLLDLSDDSAVGNIERSKWMHWVPTSTCFISVCAHALALRSDGTAALSRC